VHEQTITLPTFVEGADSWLDGAACKDLPIEAFFVQAGHIIDEEVLNVCRGCPVRVECVRHAYNPKLSVTGGYFGGLSPGQRRDMSLDEAFEFIGTDLVDTPRRIEPEYDPDDEPIVYS